jgi:hypothetical protein
MIVGRSKNKGLRKGQRNEEGAKGRGKYKAIRKGQSDEARAER